VLEGVQPSPELEEHIRERAGGNPFFVEELVRFLKETGGLVKRNGQMELVHGVVEKLPSTLTGVLVGRLDRLEQPVRGVAQVGSVIGRSFAVGVLARVMRREEAALDVPLRSLQQAEIAFPRRSGDPEYVFKHVSMRDAAYNTLVLRRRQELHLATARAIAALYPSDEYVEIIAFHYARTDVPEAIQWLERAGDRAAAVYATESALGHYGEAVETLKLSAGESLSVARVEEKLGSVLAAAGRYDEALDVLSRAVNTNRELGDLEATGRVTAQMGVAHRWRGTPEEGLALVQPMVLLSEKGASEALASLQLALANLFYVLGRYQEQQVAADQAGEIARAVRNDRLLGEAEERRGTALSELDHPEDGLEIFAGAMSLIEAGGDLSVLWRALNSGYACERLGRMEAGARYTEQALAVVERTGNREHAAIILANLGTILITLGHWEEARKHLERAMALLGDRTNANPLCYLGRLSLYEGRWADAARYLEDAVTTARKAGWRWLLEESQAFLGELDIVKGVPGGAVSRLHTLANASEANLRIFSPLVWAYLEVGALDKAEALSRETVKKARTGKQHFFLQDLLRVEGMIRIRQKRFEQANAALQEALELGRSLPYPYAEGRALHQLVLLAEQTGKLEQGRSAFAQALRIFRGLGAARDMELTGEALSRLRSA
jgi:predicted ATPase